MASLSVSPSTAQYGSAQRSVAQARRAAEQAQQTASTVQAQARDAWATVKRAESEARALDSRSSQATAKAEQAQQNIASLSDRGQSQPWSLKQANTAPDYAAAVSNFPSPINKQAQRLGVLINTTA